MTMPEYIVARATQLQVSGNVALVREIMPSGVLADRWAVRVTHGKRSLFHSFRFNELVESFRQTDDAYLPLPQAIDLAERYAARY